MEHRRTDEEFSLRSNGSRDCPIEGMESVVATVSGYHGSERFKLIKLINQTGASYVGAMTKSTTHLVCWKFEGRKYNLAKEFGTIIVSHRWFEDCEKEGKRLPERRYVMQRQYPPSVWGKQLKCHCSENTKPLRLGIKAGPISWEPPVASVRESFLTTNNGNVLSDRSNIWNDTMATQIDKGCLGTSFHLLSKTLVPELRKETKKFHKNKNPVGSSISKQDSRYSSKRRFIEKGFSGIGRDQHEASSSYPLSDSGKQKRAVGSSVGSAVRVEPTRKSRRLVKKNASRDIYESLISDGEQEPDPIEFYDQIDAIPVPSNDSDDVKSNDALTMLASELECSPTHFCNHTNITATSNDSNVLTNEDALMPERTSLQDGFHDGENRNVELQDIEDITRLNNMPPSGPNTSNDNLVCSQARSSPTGFCDFEENMDGVFKDGESSEPNRLPPSTELSCVICWTEFSSIRGILPCGHRFCYSCIQNWADHNASIRKASTCPLCKANFVSITKVVDAVSSDQKIYSQTIPCASSATTDIFVLSDWDFGAQFSAASVCYVCRSREPEDLLVSCHMCRNRWVHSYCLDPPLVPWTCVTCMDLRRLYQHIR